MRRKKKINWDSFVADYMLFMLILMPFCIILSLFAYLGLEYQILSLKEIVGEPSDLQMFEEISKRFSESHNYSGKYNCVNYSSDYKEVMEHLGYNVSIVIGANNEISHAWNKACFDIEPQYASLADYRQKYPSQFGSIQEYMDGASK